MTLFRMKTRCIGNTDVAHIRVPEHRRRSRCLERKVFSLWSELAEETISTACLDPEEHPGRSYGDGWTAVCRSRRLHGNFFCA